MKARRMFLSLAAGALLLAGCGEIPLKKAMPDYIKAVAIPPLENKSAEPALDFELSKRVVQGFIVDGRLQVAPTERAQALVKGTIQRFDRLVLTRDANQVPQQYKLQLVVDLDFVDLKDGKEALLWSTRTPVDGEPGTAQEGFDSTNTRTLREFTDYYVINVAGVPPEDERTALERLMDQMARRIVRRCLDGR